MILNLFIVICGYLAVVGLLSCILAKIEIEYTSLKIEKDLTRIFIRLGLLTTAISISTGYLSLLLKLLKMI